jgi:hypothetical protein
MEAHNSQANFNNKQSSNQTNIQLNSQNADIYSGSKASGYLVQQLLPEKPSGYSHQQVTTNNKYDAPKINTSFGQSGVIGNNKINLSASNTNNLV